MKRVPTLRAQWLGKMLRDLREQSGMTLREVADYLRRDISSLSRFESGIYPLRRGDVVDLMDLYGVEGEHQRTAMLQLAEEISKTGWWDKYAKDVWRSTIDYVWLENRAEQMRTFNPMLIPGIVQTQEYAQEIISVTDRRASKQQVERWLSVRMTRQEILKRDPPARLDVIVDEAVLHRPVGGRKTMAGQLRHLHAVAGWENVTIRVLPYHAGAYPSTDGAFTLIKMEDPFPEVAHVESPAGMIFLESDDVTRFAGLFDRLSERCLSFDESAAFIAALEKDLP